MSKKIGIGNELLPMNVLVFLLIIIVTIFPSDILCLVFGLPFLLFFPGYALMAALFPKRGEPTGLERVALGIGLSIGVTILVGFAVSYTPWGLSLYPILASLAFFTVATSAIAYYRRRRLSAEERLSLSFKIDLPRWAGLSNVDKALSVILMLSILGAIGLLSYIAAAPKEGERFTEFYVLGDYPRELAVLEEATVILAIENHEGEETSYRIEVTIDGVVSGEVDPLVLVDEEGWGEEVGFVPQEAGEDQEVEFMLYKDGESDPCETLRIFIDVEG